jgi:hypothetical protein
LTHTTNHKPLTLQDVFDWLNKGLGTFAVAPAGTEFEEGYERALKDMALELVGRAAGEPLH